MKNQQATQRATAGVAQSQSQEQQQQQSSPNNKPLRNGGNKTTNGNGKRKRSLRHQQNNRAQCLIMSTVIVLGVVLVTLQSLALPQRRPTISALEQQQQKEQTPWNTEKIPSSQGKNTKEFLRTQNLDKLPPLRTIFDVEKLPPPPQSNKNKEQAGGFLGHDYHMVFSTSCDEFQDWQSFLFFYHALKVGQPGTVTRIIAGCKTPQHLKDRQEFHRQVIQPHLSPHFYLYSTPDFSHGPREKESTKYFNKPFGIYAWMKDFLGYYNNNKKNTSEDSKNKHDNDIILIVDPDMILLRPLFHVFDVRQYKWGYGTSTRKDNLESTVRHGLAIAQLYGHHDAWVRAFKGHEATVTGVKDSPSKHVSQRDADNVYPAGPPYLATGRDMARLVETWVEFLPRLHDVHSGFMAEMYAYSIAAAHLQIRHQLSETFMVSNADVREGFHFLDEVIPVDACRPELLDLPSHKPPTSTARQHLPQVLHFCQRYAIGRWFFGKYKLPPETLLNCQAPLLREPPHDVGEQYTWFLYPNLQEKNDMSTLRHRHELVPNVWTMCTMIRATNEVGTYYRQHYCQDQANMNKTFVFHTEENFEASLKDKSCPFCRKK